jgi:hypothetical protein
MKTRQPCFFTCVAQSALDIFSPFFHCFLESIFDALRVEQTQNIWFVRKNRGLIPAPVICQVSDRGRIADHATEEMINAGIRVFLIALNFTCVAF